MPKIAFALICGKLGGNTEYEENNPDGYDDVLEFSRDGKGETSRFGVKGLGIIQ